MVIDQSGSRSRVFPITSVCIILKQNFHGVFSHTLRLEFLFVNITAKTQYNNCINMAEVTAKRTAQPSTLDMVIKAITTRQEAKGSSVAGIKSTLQSMGFDVAKKNSYINSALKKGVQTGALKQVTGVGATGTFKIDTTASKAAEKAKAQKEKEKARKAAKIQKEKESKAAAREKSVAKKEAAKAKKASQKTKKTTQKAKKTTKPKKKTVKTPTKKAAAKKAVKPKKVVKPKKPATKKSTAAKKPATKK